MTLDEIEIAISFHKMNAAKVFTQMRQHIDLSVKSGWISVEDGYPEYEGVYICHFTDGDIETFPFDNDNYGVWGVKGVTVTHWQPLPSPPEAKEKG